MSRTEDPPYIEPRLIEWLDRLFPDKAPTLAMHTKEVWFRSGQASVIRRLKEEHNRQSQRSEVLTT